MLTTDHILKHFPFDNPRPGQIEIIQQILEAFENHKYVILDAPTGSGKSVIGTTIARILSNSYYLTAQKLLQDQLTSDFGESGKFTTNYNDALIDLKGRNAYECTYYKEALQDQKYLDSLGSSNIIQRYTELSKINVDCAKGECKKQGKGKLSFCTNKGFCNYLNQLNKAVGANHTLMNFYSFIFQTQLVPFRWPNRDLLIIDECHNTEQTLMDYVTVRFSDLPFGVTFPKLESPEEYMIYFEEIELMEFIKSKISQSVAANNDEDEEYWTKQALKYKNFKETISNEDWVVKFETKEISKDKAVNTVEFKPIYVRSFSDMIFSKSDKILMMSATIISADIMADSLGINKDEYTYLSMPNLFPVKNRPIYYKPSGSMSFKNKAETMPRMINDIDDILEKHAGERGIIHTHSFDLTNTILNKVHPEHKHRLTSQIQYQNKNELLKAHAEKTDSVIIAPAFHEGVDLKDDLSRFQIICKVPYPAFQDNPQLKRRMEISPEYYLYLSSLKLVQSYGRSIRNERDYATTYILDSDFKSFVARTRMLPKWFTEAIVWQSK